MVARASRDETRGRQRIERPDRRWESASRRRTDARTARRATTVCGSMLVVAVMAIAGCGGDNPTVTPVITSAATKDSTDLVFRLCDHQVRDDGSQLLSVVGLLQGRAVGFDLELGRWHENGPGFVNVKSYQCTARLSSQGGPSDTLLAFLDEHYQTRVSSGRMKPAIEVQAISVFVNPGRFEGDAVKLILCLHPDWDEQHDSEIFVEVDKRAQRVYLQEKHVRFRRAFVEALSEPE